MYVIIPYYIEFNGLVMASMKIKTVQVILKKRKDAIEREARAEDDGERANPPPPQVRGTGQARGGDDIP